MKGYKNLLYGIVIIISILISIVMAISLLNPVETDKFLYTQSGKTWVEIDPIQCGLNSWEIDWRDNHKGEQRPEENDMVKNYYQEQGVTVFDIKKKDWNKPVCEACTCPAGYTLYLLVSDSDVNKMVEFGFRISE